MTETELRKLDEEMVGAFMAHDVDLILSYCADDVHVEDYGAAPAHGKEEVRAYLTEQFSAFSNEKAAHVKRIIGDNQVFSELAWSATNTGDIPMPDGSAVPATGKDVAARVAYYARVNDAGEVVEMRSYPDIAGVMAQIGLMGG